MASSAPQLVAGKQAWKKRGPPNWTVGSKLNESQIFHQNVLKSYPSPFSVCETGNDSMFQGFKAKELPLSVDSFIGALKPSNSELFNGKRMNIGWSEAVAAMESMNQLITDGVAREIFHPNVGTKWSALWTRLDLSTACRQLNYVGYPTEVRSPQSFEKSVENLLHFSNAVRQDWGWFSELYCRHGTGYVDCAWILSFGGITHPGFLIKSLEGAETHTDQTSLKAKPTSARALRDFLVAELLQANGLRKTTVAAAASSSGPIPDLNFDLSDEEAAVPAAVVAVDLDLLKIAFKRLEKFNPRKSKHGADKAAKLAAFKTIYKDVVDQWQAVDRVSAETVVTFEALKSLAKSKQAQVNALP